MGAQRLRARRRHRRSPQSWSGEVLDEELAAIREQVRGRRPSGSSSRPATIFEQVALADDFVDFLTLPAYDAGRCRHDARPRPADRRRARRTAGRRRRGAGRRLSRATAASASRCTPSTSRPTATTAGPVADWGRQAIGVLDEHGGAAADLAEALGLPAGPGRRGRTTGCARKLAAEPIEDLRIDFEDGYGNRPDDEEDARGRARPRWRWPAASRPAPPPPFHGIRFKSLEAPTRRRGLRTLRPVRRRARRAAGGLADGFVVTLPKVTSVDQVEAMVARLRRGSRTAHGLAAGALRFEIQVETPQSILGADGTRAGRADDPRRRRAACTGLHYGTYDYSASLRHRGGVPEHGAPGRRPRQGGHAGRRGRHRGLRLRRLDQRAAGRRPRRRACGLAAARPAGPPLARARASTRAGTCTRRSCRAATSRRTRSTARACRPPPPGCRPTCTAGTPATSTSRPPRLPSPAFVAPRRRVRRGRRRRGRQAGRRGPGSARGAGPASVAGRAPQ